MKFSWPNIFTGDYNNNITNVVPQVRSQEGTIYIDIRRYERKQNNKIARCKSSETAGSITPRLTTKIQ